MQHLISMSLFLRFPFSRFHSVFCLPWGQPPQLVLSGCYSSDPLGGAVEWKLGYYCLHCSDHTSLWASPRPPVAAGRHKCHTRETKMENMIFSMLGLGVNHPVLLVYRIHEQTPTWLFNAMLTFMLFLGVARRGLLSNASCFRRAAASAEMQS